MTTETSTATTTTRPSNEVEIFPRNPLPATPLDTDTLKKGFQTNQIISAGKFNHILSQVQQWTVRLDDKRKHINDRISSLNAKNMALQDRFYEIKQILPQTLLYAFTLDLYRKFYQTMAQEGYAKAFEKFELVDDEVIIVFDDPTHPYMLPRMSQELYRIADDLWNVWDEDKLWYTYQIAIIAKSVSICKSNNRSKTSWRSIYDGLRSFNGEPLDGRFIKNRSLLYLNSRELNSIVSNNRQSKFNAFEDEYKYYYDKPGSYSFPNGYVLPKLKGIKAA